MVDVNNKYSAPAIDKTAFNCPHCGTKTTQYWHDVFVEIIDGVPKVMKVDSGKSGFLKMVEMHPSLSELPGYQYAHKAMRNAFVSSCMECGKFALWFGSRLVLPRVTNAPAPSADMPEDVKTDYEEASRILSLSPRGAAALLRLAVERLCIDLGYKSGNINTKIGKMVADGLPHEVERALDLVRVIGNNAVHPGHLDMKDDLTTATKLFEIVNYIVMDRITRPNELARLFETKVTDGQKAEIAKRRPKPRDSEG